jgi:hypothetical protein
MTMMGENFNGLVLVAELWDMTNELDVLGCDTQNKS